MTKGAFFTPPIMDGSGLIEPISDIMPPEPTGPRLAASRLLGRSGLVRQSPKPLAVMPPRPGRAHFAGEHSVKAAAHPNRRIDVENEDQDDAQRRKRMHQLRDTLRRDRRHVEEVAVPDDEP